MTEPASVPHLRSRRRRTTLIIALAIVAAFGYYVWRIVTYNPDAAYVVEVDIPPRFRLSDNQWVWCIGCEWSPPEVRDQGRKVLSDLILRRYIRMEYDQKRVSTENRVLTYVFVDTPRGELFINEFLIRQGLVEHKPEAPNLKYRERLDAAQRAAQTEGLGLWAYRSK